MILQPVSGVRTITITDGMCSSKNRRIALTIQAKGDCYIGDENVSAANGIKLADGEKITIPMNSSRIDQIYVAGTCVCMEYF